MADNKNSTQTSSKLEAITVDYQLLDDLYFSCVSQKKMNEIGGSNGSLGKCGVYLGEIGSLVFVIYVKKGLDIDNFLKVFYHEFYHYCTNKIIYNWLNPQLKREATPLDKFVSEMLSEEACWNCKLFGTITCGGIQLISYTKRTNRHFLNL